MTRSVRFPHLLATAFGLGLALLASFAAAEPVASKGEWSGGRPPECDPEGQANVWERAKAPELEHYCSRLAEGASQLSSGGMRTAVQTRVVIQAADDAEKAFPGHAAARVLRGRALVELGQAKDGIASLDEAAALDPRSVDDPSAMLALARGEAALGQMDKSRATYGALLTRAAGLPLVQRGAAFFEAGLLSMAEGPTAIDEAADRFREAVRGGQDATRLVAVTALALALDRAGRGDEGAALLADRGAPRADLFDDPRVKASLVLAAATAEAKAMNAIALDAAHETAKARVEWRAYADAAPNGPWHDQAAAHASGATKPHVATSVTSAARAPR